MKIFIEIITVLWQAFWGILKAFGTTIWDNLPAILEIKKVMGYFTPAGMIALYLGVPLFVVSLALFMDSHFLCPSYARVRNCDIY